MQIPYEVTLAHTQRYSSFGFWLCFIAIYFLYATIFCSNVKALVEFSLHTQVDCSLLYLKTFVPKNAIMWAIEECERAKLRILRKYFQPYNNHSDEKIERKFSIRRVYIRRWEEKIVEIEKNDVERIVEQYKERRVERESTYSNITCTFIGKHSNVNDDVMECMNMFKFNKIEYPVSNWF